MRKKILFLTAFLPHPGAAAEKNTMLMLEDLSHENDVDLVYFKYADEKEYVAPNEHINILKAYNNSLTKKLINIALFPIVHPMFSVRFSWNVLSFLNDRIKGVKYDAVVCDHSQMFLYGKYLKTTAPKIMLAHDVIAQRVGRTSNAFMKWICTKSEGFAMSAENAHIFSFSQKDCDLIKDIYGIPARLNLDYIAPSIIEATPVKVENNYIFIGKWSRADNLDGVVWFFKEIAPLIKEDVTISIIGKGFPEDKISNSNSHVKVNVLGFVENPYEMIANCTAVLSPLFTGAGIKVKVIESLACGSPVIGTDIAFEGLDAKYSDFMLLCKEPFDYIKAMEVARHKSLNERKQMKSMFIDDYQSETIPNYLKKILA